MFIFGRSALQALALLRGIMAQLHEVGGLLVEIRDELLVQSNAVLKVTLPNGGVLEGDHVMAQISDVQTVGLKFVEQDGKGNPVGAPASVSFSSSNPLVVSVSQVTPGGPDAVATAVGPLGTATVTASGDGLTAVVDITVVASAATSATIEVGTPTP